MRRRRNAVLVWDDACNAPEIDVLTDAEFRLWVLFLVRFGMEDVTFDREDVAWWQYLNIGKETAEDTLARMCSLGLWERRDNGYGVTPNRDLWRPGPVIGVRPSIPRDLRERVYDRDGRRCVTCGSTDDLTLDHIHPFSLGGEDSESNLQTLCRSCNCKKGAKV